MTSAQIAAIETALATAAAAVRAEYPGDFLVGVVFAPTTAKPTAGQAYPSSLALGFGQFAHSSLRAIPPGVEVVELLPLAHRKEEQQ